MYFFFTIFLFQITLPLPYFISYFMLLDFTIELRVYLIYEHFKQAPSTSKSKTINFVSSVPFRDPTAHINFVSFDLQKNGNRAFKNIF